MAREKEKVSKACEEKDAMLLEWEQLEEDRERLEREVANLKAALMPAEG